MRRALSIGSSSPGPDRKYCRAWNPARVHQPQPIKKASSWCGEHDAGPIVVRLEEPRSVKDYIQHTAEEEEPE